MSFTLRALAGHFAGDYPLQTDWMAATKFDDPLVRATHVSICTAAQAPAALSADWSRRQQLVYLVTVWFTHFVIDTQRWQEPVDGFETFPVWYDQALHIISLAVAEWLASR
jgi:hypothetical protein